MAKKPASVGKIAKPKTAGSLMCRQVKNLLRGWHFNLEDMIESADDSKYVVANLVKAADKYQIMAKDVHLFPHIMSEFGLLIEELTGPIISRANAIDRQHMEGVSEAVTIINRMDSLLSLQRKWEASGVSTFEEFMQRRNPTAAAPVSESPVAVMESPDESSRVRQSVFGHTVTSVLRWMGQEGWTKEQAATALEALDVEAAEGTIAINLKLGQTADWKRGGPAELTDDQATEIYGKI